MSGLWSQSNSQQRCRSQHDIKLRIIASLGATWEPIVTFRAVYLNSAIQQQSRLSNVAVLKIIFEVALKYYYIKMLSACFKAKNLQCVVEQVA